MKYLIRVLLLFLAIGSACAWFTAGPVHADSKQHHAAVKICRQRYKDAVRGLKRLKHRDREARIAQARRERDECIARAPR
jgi:hypothetical protein